MNCPKCGSALEARRQWDGSHYCFTCREFFSPLAPNEAEKEIHLELPSGAMARVTLEGAKDPKLLEALNEMMIAVANQCSAPNEYERLKVQKDAILKKQESAEIARLASKLAEMEKERQRLLDLVRHQRAELHETGLISDQEYADLAAIGSESARRLESYDDICIERDSIRQELEKMRGEG